MAGGGGPIYRLLLSYIGFWYRLGIFRWNRLSGFRQWLDRRLITRFGLFDPQFYLELYPDVAGANLDPLRHYIAFGRAERRKPHLLFDTHYYLSQVPAKERHILPPIHFILFGCEKGLSPNRWFDPKYYLEHAVSGSLKPRDAFFHYATVGNQQNLRPSLEFNPRRFLRLNPQAKAEGMTAMDFFIRQERESLTEEIGAFNQLPKPRLQDKQSVGPNPLGQIRKLAPMAHPSPAIDVVVPVYGAREETLNCLWHVLKAKNATPFRLVVVDDRSPDEQLTNELQELADEGYFHLIFHKENQGFVQSVNDGMSVSDTTDVILLNSDTEVYGDWVDRLQRVAQSEATIGTVTPITNNGTICSYPAFPHDNPLPLEINYPALDELASETNGDAWVQVPTAIGFCMYIKRETLNDVGLFDVEAFGRGYGEENDFCLRAQQAGWKDAAAPGIFIRHFGSLSFSGEKAERVEAALKVIRDRYPFYEHEVRTFIGSDPLKPYREALDIARLAKLGKERNILIVSHVRGGGTEQHVQEITSAIEGEGGAIYRLVPAPGSPGRVQLYHQDLPNLVNLPSFGLGSELNDLAALLRTINITEVHIHHTIDFGSNAVWQLSDLIEALAVPYEVTVHDYFSICPRINLVDESGFYCGEPDEVGCNACLAQRGSLVGRPEIKAWRSGFEHLLTRAAKVLAPSQDVANRLGAYFPDVAATVVSHEEPMPPAPWKAPRGEKPLRIGTVGAISAVKGFHVLAACAEWARANQPDLRFVVLGFTEDDHGAERCGVEIAGPYAHDRILEEISEQSFDLIFLPSVCPETYSYVLSSALQTGLPIVVFDIGAPAERLRGVPQGLVLPLDMAKEPDALVKRLVAHAEIANVGGNPPS
jgi:GT2 family glycosyltransferase/glycosyltransferase involved in cell wall biosynthesis